MPLAFGLESASFGVEMLHAADVSWLRRQFDGAPALDYFNHRFFDFLHREFLALGRSDAEGLAQEILHLRQRIAANYMNFDVAASRFSQLLRLSFRMRFQREDDIRLIDICGDRRRNPHLLNRAFKPVSAQREWIDAEYALAASFGL